MLDVPGMKRGGEMNLSVYLQHRFQLFSVLHDHPFEGQGPRVGPVRGSLLAWDAVGSLRLELGVGHDPLHAVETALKHGSTLDCVLHELSYIQNLQPEVT